MSKEDFKIMMKELLNNEKQVYNDLARYMKDNNTLHYKEMCIAIERIIKHIDSGFYDNQIEVFCKYIEDETLKEADKEIEKKKRTKKKAE